MAEVESRRTYGDDGSISGDVLGVGRRVRSSSKKDGGDFVWRLAGFDLGWGWVGSGVG